MIRGAIFDADGTLLDSMTIWDTIGEDYLRSLGYEPKEDLKETFKTFTLQQAACYYRSNYGIILSVDEIVDGINGMLEQYYREKVLLKSGVGNFLQKLNKNGVKMCIATTSDRYLIEAALNRCGVLKYFSEIFTCTFVGHGKEEPVIYREALKYLGTEKSHTVVFEDAFHAIETAKNDGFITAAVYDTHEESQESVKSLADFYITDNWDFETFWKFASGL